jgi:hypothetical protein
MTRLSDLRNCTRTRRDRTPGLANKENHIHDI